SHAAGRRAKPEKHLKRNRALAVRHFQRLWNGVDGHSSSDTAFESMPPHDVTHAADPEGADGLFLSRGIVRRRDTKGQQQICLDLQHLGPSEHPLQPHISCGYSKYTVKSRFRLHL